MPHRKKKRLIRVGGLALCLSILLSCLPTGAFALSEDGLCEHHPEHTEECGYIAAVEGAPCTHKHTDDCYSIIQCVHEHNEDCKENCTHVCNEESGCITVKHNCHHNHDENCGYSEGIPASDCTHECGEECAEGCIHEHDETCGYAEEIEAAPCNHVCSIEGGCYELLCTHAAEGQHDDACGYVEGKAGQPCGFVCKECAAVPEIPAEDEQPVPDEGNSVTDTGSESEIASATITWGAMNFTYSDGTWNTGTYVYDGAGWTLEGNTVTVANTGNVGITASVAYQNENGYNFTGNWDKETASIPKEKSETFTLTLSGKPAEALDKKKVGTVTVTIQQADQTT